MNANRITRRGFLGQSLGAAAAAVVAGNGESPIAAADPADAWKIGIFTRPWASHDYRIGLDAAAEAGFKHVGLLFAKWKQRSLLIDYTVPVDEAAAIGEEAHSRGLRVPVIYSGRIPVENSIAEGVVGLRRLIDNCVAARGETLLLGGTSTQEQYNAYFKAIAECCDYASEKKLKLAIKPHGGVNATGAQCRAIIERVGHPNFSLWYDPGNIYYYSKGKIDPVDDAAKVAGLVRHGICVKDFELIEKGGEQKPNVLVIPGQGQVDFPGVMQALGKGGFRGGDLVIETVSAGNDSLSHLLTEAKAARKFVAELVSS